MGFDTVLITGGSGFFGNHLVRRLLSWEKPPRRIVVFSRGEYRQFLMGKELWELDKQGSLRFLIGDVRDRERLRRAMEDVEVVIHAAALKRIEVGQYNPNEVIKTNVDGTVNVVEAAKDARVKKVVYLSSDKAFQPVSPYGLTKALGEQIVLTANNTRGWNGPKYSVTRYGNVSGSTGSVIPLWREVLMTRDTVRVTDPEVTRFWMWADEAVDLVLNTLETMPALKPVIPTLPAYRLGDLAEAMGAKMEIVGLPEYEKRHEGMDHGNTSDVARRLTVEELREMLDKLPVTG
jgi:UDP-N-acetylglucosamine 4,6-dehydratase